MNRFIKFESAGSIDHNVDQSVRHTTPSHRNQWLRRLSAAAFAGVTLSSALTGCGNGSSGPHDIALYLPPGQKHHGWRSSGIAAMSGEAIIYPPLDILCTNGQSAKITGFKPYKPGGDGNAKLEVVGFGTIPIGQEDKATEERALHRPAIILRGPDSCDQNVPAHEVVIDVKLVDAKPGERASVIGWEVETTRGSVLETTAMQECDGPKGSDCPPVEPPKGETWGGQTLPVR